VLFSRYDRRILEILQQDGRLTNQELADRIGLSPSPCLRRVPALEEASGVVRYQKTGVNIDGVNPYIHGSAYARAFRKF